MLFSRATQWESSGITNKLHQMFVEHWQELFDRETPDTWQVRTTNFPGILRELVAVIDVCAQHPLYKHNIPVLLEEAQAVTAIDPVLNRHFPQARALLPAERDQYLGEHARDHQAELRRRIQVILGHIQEYPTILVRDLRDLLESENEREKGQLYYLSVALATEWSARGYSWSHLAAGTEELLHSATHGTFLDRFDRFVGRCNGKVRSYVCRLGLNLPHAASVADLSLPEFKFTRGEPKHLETPVEEEFYRRASATDVFVDLDVNALDTTTARRTAEDRVFELFGALNLFLPSHQFSLRGRRALVWATEEGEKEKQLVPLRQFREHGLRNSENAAKQASLFVQMRHRLAEEDRD
jgi:hypothetical protein